MAVCHGKVDVWWKIKNVKEEKQGYHNMFSVWINMGLCVSNMWRMIDGY